MPPLSCIFYQLFSEKTQIKWEKMAFMSPVIEFLAGYGRKHHHYGMLGSHLLLLLYALVSLLANISF
uniref:Uncharacterized protein n=1 Tax=Rhizophora mucronata TaxID=61149 RepID=A0A2P2Q6Y3_RHIMU